MRGGASTVLFAAAITTRGKAPNGRLPVMQFLAIGMDDDPAMA
jgi:hypothetical protein